MRGVSLLKTTGIVKIMYKYTVYNVKEKYICIFNCENC